MLTWMAETCGPAMGVPQAVLFDVCPIAFDGPPPWVADAGR
jgi:hypothetical protein